MSQLPSFANISLLKNFRFAQSDEKFLRENNLPIQTYTANIWHAIDMYENIVTRIFLIQNFLQTKLTRITVISAEATCS